MIETERLILRQWKKSDSLPFINMGLDPDVMKYLPNLLTENESLEIINKIEDVFDKKHWGFWAVELKETGEFIGFIGLHDQPEQFDFSPCVEIGWRLAKEHWGKGYATEGAKAALEYAFNKLKLKKVVSFTSLANKQSESIMKKIGMTKVSYFNHPEFSSTPDLEKHILYEMSNPYLT